LEFRIRKILNFKLAFMKKLKGHTEINSEHVSIHALEGFVVLKGSVDSAETKATIKALAEGVLGVLDVVNDLELDKSSDVAKGISAKENFRISELGNTQDE